MDRTGFPLEIACFEGNKAETHTIIPVVKAFQDRHQVADMVVVADAGMLSAANLDAINEAGLRFIVGSRVTRAPHDLAKHFHWHGTAFTDGQVINTITQKRTAPDPDRLKTRKEPVWDPQQHPQAWRAIWQYSHKRAARDRKTLAAQRERAMAIVDGVRPAKKARFVKTTGQTASLDEASLQRATDLVGLKGYVTNITASTMPAAEVIASYHDLWRVEQSFRMSKSDFGCTADLPLLEGLDRGPPHHRVHRPRDRPRPTSPHRLVVEETRPSPAPLAARHHPTRRSTTPSRTQNPRRPHRNPRQIGSLNLCKSGRPPREEFFAGWCSRGAARRAWQRSAGGLRSADGPPRSCMARNAAVRVPGTPHQRRQQRSDPRPATARSRIDMSRAAGFALAGKGASPTSPPGLMTQTWSATTA